MKSYTVLWRETATEQLAEIWIDASSRTEINASVKAIEAVLSSSPMGDLTLDLAEGLRALTVTPLRVIFAVEEQDRIVDVATVRRVV